MAVLAGIVVLLVTRLIQLEVPQRGTLWWGIEALRWAMTFGFAVYVVAWATKVELELHRHRQRMQEISREIAMARLDLDLSRLEPYADRVGS